MLLYAATCAVSALSRSVTVAGLRTTSSTLSDQARQHRIQEPAGHHWWGYRSILPLSRARSTSTCRAVVQQQYWLVYNAPCSRRFLLLFNACRCLPCTVCRSLLLLRRRVGPRAVELCDGCRFPEGSRACPKTLFRLVWQCSL